MNRAPLLASASGQIVTRRLRRSRGKGSTLPPGTIYVGRPTLWGNPFRSDRFGHARAVKLHARWLDERVSIPELLALGLSDAEAQALKRLRDRALAHMPRLAGANLACWCPLTTPLCHAETLLTRARSFTAMLLVA